MLIHYIGKGPWSWRMESLSLKYKVQGWWWLCLRMCD